MASANDSTPSTRIQAGIPETASTSVQAVPPVAQRAIPSPERAKPAAVAPEQLAARTRPLDALLVVVVFVLTFMLASFAARNNDLLLHLATGRAWLDGSYQFGQDPFSFTTEGVPWVNHSWLFDVSLYGLFTALGGPALVAIKAVLVTVLLGFMLAVRRREQSLWIPAVCGGIAALAFSPRLQLQPILISYLFLGITLWLLQKPAQGDANTSSKHHGAGPATRRHLWVLPILFLFWANLDQWFFLGPLTVALYWAGELIQEGFAGSRDEANRRPANDNRTLGLVLVVGLAACVLNPHHIHVFTLPPHLTESGAAGALQGDPQFGPLFWGAIDYYKSGAGWSVAGVAYLVLLGLGVLSFVVNRRDWRGWRIVIWVAFAGLSIYHARTIPFFAVIGGPIAALNFQDAVGRYFGTVPKTKRGLQQWAIGGRVLTLAIGAVLLALAWPGWLHATLARGEALSRNVAWRVEFEPSLRQAAEQFDRWHKEGVLGPDDRGLNMAPDIAYAFAWFAPEEKGFIDIRLALFEKAAKDYLAAAKALHLDPESRQSVREQLDALVQVLRQNKANHLTFHYSDPSRILDVLALFENDPLKQWTLVYRDGRTAIVSWDDPKRTTGPSRLTQTKVSDEHLAFGPQEQPPLTERPAAPELLAWYERYLHPRRPRPLAGDEAGMLLHYFRITLPHHRQRGLEKWLYTQAASVVASGALGPPAGELLYRAVITDAVFEVTRGDQRSSRMKRWPLGFPDLAVAMRNRQFVSVPGPMGTPVLAVRAARRALLENPNDAVTWFWLQSAYGVLSQETREREWTARLPLLQSVRQVQRIGALNHAVMLDPDLEPAHRELASLYEQMSIPGQGGYVDLALKHRTEELRLLREAGPSRFEKPEDYQNKLKGLEDYVDRLDAMVKKAQNDYEVGQVSRTTLAGKAQLALTSGLGGQARDDLVHSLEVTVEPEALPLQLNLMVMTGALEGEEGIRIFLDRARQEAEETGRKPNLGRFPPNDPLTVPMYEWLEVLVGAASGDYSSLDRFMEPIVELRQQVHRDFTRARTRADVLDLLFGVLDPRAGGGALSDLQMTPLALGHAFVRTFRLENLKSAAASKPQIGDIYALRGIFALEAGNLDHARKMFDQIIEIKDANLEPVARYYLDLMNVNR